MLSSEVVTALSDHGERVLRRAALDIAGHALAAADPGRAARALLSFDGDALSISDERLALDAETRIFVVGAGKATFPIAAVLDEVLGPRIHAGLVVGKRGERAALTHIETRLAAHPVPDDASLAAARDTHTLLSTARPGDLVIACFTGGSSALFSEPAGGFDVADKRRLNKLLLASGVDIRAINAVRKHVSRVRGGRLAAALPAGCRLVNLTVSDVICDPTVPDGSTLADARAGLEAHGLWDEVPVGIRLAILHGKETPKAADLAHVERRDHILVPADAAVRAAAEAATSLGFEARILTTSLDGDSEAAAEHLARTARTARADGGAIALIAGGETTVRLGTAPAGRGGPNQHFALAAARALSGVDGVAVLSLDTDGTDGPTQVAGGLVDGVTYA